MIEEPKQAIEFPAAPPFFPSKMNRKLLEIEKKEIVCDVALQG